MTPGSVLSHYPIAIGVEFAMLNNDLVCLSLTGLVIVCVIAYVDKHRCEANLTKDFLDESDLLFTRLYNLLQFILPMFGGAISSDDNSSSVSGNRGSTGNKGYEKTLQQLFSVLKARKIASAVGLLKFAQI